MTKIALFVIYNHRYDKNINRIEDLYKGKFEHLFHIVPFYDGNKGNVIAVYENSYNFQGYIAQALSKIDIDKYTHFFFVADDMVLNPAINENNLWKQIGLDYDENYIPELMDLSKRESNWTRYNEAMFYHPENSGAEVMGILPKWDCAQKKLCQFIKTSGYVSYTDALKIVFSRTSFSRPTSLLLKTIIRFCTKPFQKFKLPYPVVGGYSDIFLINRESLDDFIKYIGAFAATRLFVEIAIPTALCLSSEKLKTEKELRKSGEVYWNDDITAFGEKYSFSLAQLFKDFNPNTFYIHPVKLSKWK